LLRRWPRRAQDLEEQVAARLARGQIVARFDGPMEFGPRSLGNRSILAAATDRTMTDRLNLALTRSDFMPFAPVLLAEDADEWTDGLETCRDAARYMTVTTQAKPELARLCPAAVHVDGSLRPQLADATTPSLTRTLAAYRRITGVPAFINTSFNLHEEPIVCSPQEAIATWRAARIDALAIGPFLVGA
jgi:carbamoyltransferase